MADGAAAPGRTDSQPLDGGESPRSTVRPFAAADGTSRTAPMVLAQSAPSTIDASGAGGTGGAGASGGSAGGTGSAGTGGHPPPSTGGRSGETGGGGGGNQGSGQPWTVASALPALLAIGGLVAVIVATLGLVGASDIPSLTRGAPWPTFGGASLLLAGVILTGIAAVLVNLRRGLITAGYVAALVGLILYLVAGIHVTSDPTAPKISITPVTATEATTVTVDADGMSFNERLQVGATFAGERGLDFHRIVIGGGTDGKASHEFVVEPQAQSRRLQVTAQVLGAKEIPRDLRCNEEGSGRKCAEAAAQLQRGMPEVQAKLRGQILGVRVVDARRIPGLIAVSVRRRGQEIYATRTRVAARAFKVSIRLNPRPAPAKGSAAARKRDTVCVAASYGTSENAPIPSCSRGDAAETIVFLYPSRRAVARSTAR